MKHFTLIAALLLGTAASADTKTLLGCEVVKADNGNYYNLVDPSCNLGSNGGTGNDKLWDYINALPEPEPEEPTDPECKGCEVASK